MLNREGRAVRGSRLLALGLSYKAGTSDWRESPACVVVRKLAALGAQVRVVEPRQPVGVPLDLDCEIVEPTVAEIADADLVVLLVDHPELPYDDIAEHARLVLDTRGRLRGRRYRGEAL